MSQVNVALEATMGLGVKPPWTELRDGESKDMTRLFRFKKRKRTRRDFGRMLHKDGEGGKNDWTRMKLPSLSEVIAERMWRAMGWACDPQPHVAVKTLKT